MAKFRFQLDAVLRQRLAIERQKQLGVAELERERVEMENQIRTLQSSLATEKQTMREALAPKADPILLRDVRAQANASLHLVARAQQTVLKLAGVHARLDRARRDLLEAVTQRRAVETLKQRRYEAWLLEQRGVEARALDEMAVMRAGRDDYGMGGGDDDSPHGEQRAEVDA
jgi:flagellar FliJ protein